MSEIQTFGFRSFPKLSQSQMVWISDVRLINLTGVRFTKLEFFGFFIYTSIKQSSLVKNLKPNVRTSEYSRCPKFEVPFGKPNKIWFRFQTFGFQTFGSIVRLYYKCPKSERSVSQVEQPNVWNPNCLGMGQLWKVPKSEPSDFRLLLYLTKFPSIFQTKGSVFGRSLYIVWILDTYCTVDVRKPDIPIQELH